MAHLVGEEGATKDGGQAAGLVVLEVDHRGRLFIGAALERVELTGAVLADDHGQPLAAAAADFVLGADAEQLGHVDAMAHGQIIPQTNILAAMAEVGQRIEGIDSTIEFIETTAGSDGERVVVEISYSGEGGKPPAHLHPSQTEHFEVLEGEIFVLVGDVEHQLRPGDTLDIPAGTAHQMWCTVPSRQRWTTTPALRTEGFFETLWGLQQDGKTGGAMPGLPQMALILRRFSDEFRLASPPGPLQELLTMPLAALGRLAGKQAEYSPKA